MCVCAYQQTEIVTRVNKELSLTPGLSDLTASALIPVFNQHELGDSSVLAVVQLANLPRAGLLFYGLESHHRATLLCQYVHLRFPSNTNATHNNSASLQHLFTSVVPGFVMVSCCVLPQNNCCLNVINTILKLNVTCSES